MNEAPPRYLSTAGFAARLGISEQGARLLRITGGGPPFIKLTPGKQGRVRYSLAEVERWEQERRFASTSAYPQTTSAAVQVTNP